MRVCLPLLLLERRGGVPPLPSPEGFPIASLRRVRSIWWHPLGRGESERVSEEAKLGETWRMIKNIMVKRKPDSDHVWGNGQRGRASGGERMEVQEGRWPRI